MTRYSCQVYVNGNWEGLALFADTASIDAMIHFCDEQFDLVNNLTMPAEDICLVDMETGEVLWCWSEDHPDVNEEDWGENEDCGFDPYLGCYTDDC